MNRNLETLAVGLEKIRAGDVEEGLKECDKLDFRAGTCYQAALGEKIANNEYIYREFCDRIPRGDEGPFWVENRERFRPKGLRALRYELRLKGISNEIIEQALASVDVSASAYRSAGKKARQVEHLDQREFHQKIVEYLARRGFDYDVAREAAERHWTERMAAD